MSNIKFYMMSVVRNNFVKISRFFIVFALSIYSFGQNVGNEKLKAMLIVGYQEDGTQKAIDKIEAISQLFEENGIEVFEFYNEKANWEEIVKVAPECSFMVYCGHGSNLGENGNAGGLVINTFVSTEEIQNQLRLKENAIVIFQSVCNGAGSSADDDGDIGAIEAKNRVYNYAYPFFEIGAAVYYANNYDGGCKSFLKYFLEGETVKSCFEKSIYHFNTVEFDESFDGFFGKKISVASSIPMGKTTRTTYINGVKKVEQIPSSKSYDIAFAGSPEVLISSLLTNK